ncbi:MAG: hypothetical protein Q9195_005871 [Heterodermia aff. obscurata]
MQTLPQMFCEKRASSTFKTNSASATAAFLSVHPDYKPYINRGEHKHGVGNAVGTLGFADELIALIACPLWGVISDRIGVRAVCVLGYTIIALALVLFVQAHNVFPQLLFARMFFSIGGAATSTMVTAILPSMITCRTLYNPQSPARTATPTNGPAFSPSISSELTITQTRHQQTLARQSSHSAGPSQEPAPARLAGFVGLFTGFGAVVALVLFLPLPAVFRGRGIDPGTSIAYSYYVVAAIALIVALSVIFGLRNLAGEEGKGFSNLLQAKHTNSDGSRRTENVSSAELLLDALRLGFKSTTLALGYVGGFVARASSVCISLFIPLFVNAWFISSGMCDKLPESSEAVSLPDTNQCQRAYVVAAELTGVSQTVALVFAPIFGYMADRYPNFNSPLLLAALIGVMGYLGLANMNSPDPKASGGSPWVFFVVALLGISQIGAIVCSLGLLGRSVLEVDFAPRSFSNAEAPHLDSMLRPKTTISNETGNSTQKMHPSRPAAGNDTDAQETSALLGDGPPGSISRQHLKGSIAGVYSLAGGTGILLLTKLGGHLFDQLSPSAPFYMLAIFNGILFIFGLTCGIIKWRYRE